MYFFSSLVYLLWSFKAPFDPRLSFLVGRRGGFGGLTERQYFVPCCVTVRQNAGIQPNNEVRANHNHKDRHFENFAMFLVFMCSVFVFS